MTSIEILRGSRIARRSAASAATAGLAVPCFLISDQPLHCIICRIETDLTYIVVFISDCVYTMDLVRRKKAVNWCSQENDLVISLFIENYDSYYYKFSDGKS